MSTESSLDSSLTKDYDQSESQDLKDNADQSDDGSHKKEERSFLCEDLKVRPVDPTRSIKHKSVLNNLTSSAKKCGITYHLGLDCEFITVGEECTPVLARVSIVNYYGHVLLDSLVRPNFRHGEPIDYLTHITGLTAEILAYAPSYEEVNEHAISLMMGKVVVGHSLTCDLEKFTSLWALPTPIQTIDVSEYPPYKKNRFQKRKLKDLSADFLNA